MNWIFIINQINKPRQVSKLPREKKLMRMSDWPKVHAILPLVTPLTIPTKHFYSKPFCAFANRRISYLLHQNKITGNRSSFCGSAAISRYSHQNRILTIMSPWRH